jgi:hypothetical protein
VSSFIKPLLVPSSFLSTGDPSVRLSALVVFSVASLDFLRVLGSSTDSSYLGLADEVLLVSENTPSSGSADSVAPATVSQAMLSPKTDSTHVAFSCHQQLASRRSRHRQSCV